MNRERERRIFSYYTGREAWRGGGEGTGGEGREGQGGRQGTVVVHTRVNQREGSKWDCLSLV